MSKTIGIFCAGQAGDCLTISSVLKYRQELWGDCKIIWYIENRNRDLLKYQDIELRDFPRGFGYPELVEQQHKNGNSEWEDWFPLVDENNHMNLELKKNYPSLADIDYGYFPAPHQRTPEQRHEISYPNISRKIFGIPDDYEWHPYLLFSDEERQSANDFIKNIGEGKKIIIESFAGSGQSRLNQEMIVRSMDICKEQWGEDCKFIFASHKFLKSQESFPDGWFEQPNVYSCANFTVRQCALIADQADLMISVSSGITVAASAWGIKSPPILQFCGSEICSTVALANGPIELITVDDKRFDDAKTQFYLKLITLL